MRELLDDDGTLSARIARNALVTAKLCTITRAARAEADLLAATIEA